MRKAFQIAGLSLKQLFREKTAFIFLLLLPLIFTLLAGAMWGSAGSNEKAVPLMVVDKDRSIYSQELINGLHVQDIFELRNSSEEEARKLVQDQTAAAAVIIPRGFGEAVASGQETVVEFVRSKRQITPSLAYEALQRSLARLKGSAVTADVTVELLMESGVIDSNERSSVFEEAFLEASRQWGANPPVYTAYSETSQEGEVKETFGGLLGYSAAGFAMMFVMMGVVIAASSFLDERRDGTLARLLTSPTSKASIMGGKLLGLFLQGFLQITILMAASYVIFGVNWGRSPLALFLLVVSFLLASTGLGVLIASLVRTGSQARAIGSMVVLVSAMLGGAWWPLELVPEFMRKIALTVPTSWAMEGFYNIIDRGLGVEAVLPQVFVLLGFSALFFSVGLKTFRYL